jgi:hypothetical protein
MLIIIMVPALFNHCSVKLTQYYKVDIDQLNYDNLILQHSLSNATCRSQPEILTMPGLLMEILLTAHNE